VAGRAGYSGTPLPRKLGIGDGSRVAVVDAPPELAATVAAFPGDHVAPDDGDLDVALVFVTGRADLVERFAPVAARLATAGALWVAWPKRASKVPTDLDENVVRAVGLDAGLVDTKVCAISETWSGLRFVYRLRDRPARARAKG
jgi:Protein of unknown function (DUF3052)